MKKILIFCLVLALPIFSQSRYYHNTGNASSTTQVIEFNGLVKNITIIANIYSSSDTLWIWTTSNPAYEDKIPITNNFNQVTINFNYPISRLWLQTNGATIRRTIIGGY